MSAIAKRIIIFARAHDTLSNKKTHFLTSYVFNERIIDGLHFLLNKIFWSPFNNASFVTFCVQMDQLLESQWVFENARNFLFSIDFASKTSKQRFWLSLQRPIATQIIDRLVYNSTKRSVIYRLLIFSSKIFWFNANCRPSNIRSLPRHEWSAIVI